MNLEVSYVVVCYNSDKYVRKCIDSILNQTYKDDEILIIDNNSSDDTVSIVEEYCEKFKKIRLVQNKTNLGYGNAINKIIKDCKGDFLAILNADVWLDKEWTSNLLRFLKSRDEIVSASGNVYLPNGELLSAGGMMDKFGAVVQRGSKIFLSRHIKENVIFYNDGSSFMVKRKIFDEIQFDPKLFLYCEDLDFCWKIKLLGYKIDFEPTAISYHDMGHSSPDTNPSKFYFLARNRIYVCAKNYSLKNRISRIPVTICLLFLNAFLYDLSKKSKGYVKNFFKAIFWNISNLNNIIYEQKKLQSLSKISDNEIDRNILKSSIEFSLIKN